MHVWFQSQSLQTETWGNGMQLALLCHWPCQLVVITTIASFQMDMFVQFSIDFEQGQLSIAHVWPIANELSNHPIDFHWLCMANGQLALKTENAFHWPCVANGKLAEKSQWFLLHTQGKSSTSLQTCATSMCCLQTQYVKWEGSPRATLVLF